MKAIIKVKQKEELPPVGRVNVELFNGHFKTIYYNTKKGFYKEKPLIFYSDNKTTEVRVRFWLKEVELPTEDQVTKHYINYDGHINNPALFGAN